MSFAAKAEKGFETLKRVDECLTSAQSIAIIGHVRPDGDCVGSCLALCHYIRENIPGAKPRVYLGEFSSDFAKVLTGVEQISHEIPAEPVDLCICLDASSRERLGEFEPVFATAGRTVCIDHHITNDGFAQINAVDPKAAATAELLYCLMDPAKISLVTAQCLFTGLVHDTGVFKHSNTTKRTMEVGGALMGMGVKNHIIIDNTFLHKSFVQNRLLGRGLLNATQEFENEVIYSSMDLQEIAEFDGVDLDLEGIIDQLRLTDGSCCAVFAHETEPKVYKVSLRGNDWMDVSRVAGVFGGGGHLKAAGCTIYGDKTEVKAQLLAALWEEFRRCGRR